MKTEKTEKNVEIKFEEVTLEKAGIKQIVVCTHCGDCYGPVLAH